MKFFRNIKRLLFSIILVIIAFSILILLKYINSEEDVLDTTLIVYLENVNANERDNIKKQILNIDNIYYMEYVAKMDIINRIKSNYSEDEFPVLNEKIEQFSTLINYIDKMELYDVYEVKLRSLKKINNTINQIENIDNVKYVEKTDENSKYNNSENKIFDYLKENTTIIIYLKKNIDNDIIKKVEDQIIATDNVVTLEFVSKDEILEKYANDEKLGKYISSLDSANNPFIDMYHLKVKNMLEIDNTIETIKSNNDYIEKISY